MKQEAISVSVPEGQKEILIFKAVKEHQQSPSVKGMKIVLVFSLVKHPLVLIPAHQFPVVSMLCVFLKTMLPGVGV